MASTDIWWWLLNFYLTSEFLFWACLILPSACQLSPLEKPKSSQTQHIQYQTNHCVSKPVPVSQLVVLLLIKPKSWIHCWWTSPLSWFSLIYSHLTGFFDFTCCQICLPFFPSTTALDQHFYVGAPYFPGSSLKFILYQAVIFLKYRSGLITPLSSICLNPSG